MRRNSSGAKHAIVSYSIGVTACSAQSLDDVASERAVARFRSTCEAQGNAVWARSMCGPLVIVNAETHWAVANEQDPEKKFVNRGSVWVGTLPASFDVANTAFNWGGRKWTMVMSPLPVDPYSQIELVSHEAFHRIQESLDLAASDQPNAHLDTENGRLWLRLELRALARALRAETEQELRASVADALLFRARRYSFFPDARLREASMEKQEGLAEYTGTVIAMKETGEVVSRVARRVESFEDSDAYARSFAYVTGPAMGLLLDRLSTEWRKRVRGGASIESRLIEASRFSVSVDLAEAAATRAVHYGYSAVAAAEHAREARRLAMMQMLTKIFVNGPTLRFPERPDLSRSFNPNELVPFGEHGTYYPTGTFRADWGKLSVTEGAVLALNNRSVRVAAPKDPKVRPLMGPGWTLELAPGWTIRPIAGGSFDAVPSAGSDARQ